MPSFVMVPVLSMTITCTFPAIGMRSGARHLIPQWSFMRCAATLWPNAKETGMFGFSDWARMHSPVKIEMIQCPCSLVRLTQKSRQTYKNIRPYIVIIWSVNLNCIGDGKRTMRTKEPFAVRAPVAMATPTAFPSSEPELWMTAVPARRKCFLCAVASSFPRMVPSAWKRCTGIGSPVSMLSFTTAQPSTTSTSQPITPSHISSTSPGTTSPEPTELQAPARSTRTSTSVRASSWIFRRLVRMISRLLTTPEMSTRKSQMNAMFHVV
mmetsp:Transcript_7030/g.18003  ORF Transcript_7030/g.18003 Transcript_7030/m.18003 type:complete len:267 (-) Transcript_7030:273-1073(-)